MVGMTRLTGGMDGQGICEVAKINDHAHGRQTASLIGLHRAPTSGIDDTTAARSTVRTPIEERINGRTRSSQCLVGEGQRMQVTPRPLGGIIPQSLLELIYSSNISLTENDITSLNWVGSAVIPPGTVGLLYQAGDHFEPAAGASGPRIFR